MVDRVERVTQTTEPVAAEPAQTTTRRETAVARPDGATVLARVITYITSVLLALLLVRFLLALLGANSANAFANFIYTVSHPFVAPFFSLFSYHLRYGVSRFEIATLVAMIVYGLVGYGLARLATIGQVNREV